MSDEKRMIGDYEVLQSMHVGKREVVLAFDPKQEDPYMVCFCDFFSPLDALVPRDALVGDDYIEAVEIFLERVKVQAKEVKSERERFGKEARLFTAEDCIRYERIESIEDKVVVLDVRGNRPEYQHPAYQLVLAEGGSGAEGGRGRSVMGHYLATGESGKWYREEVIGEIRPDKMPDWAREGLSQIRRKKEERKRNKEAR